MPSSLTKTYCREAPGQALTKFTSNEDVLAHPCGECVLGQLQCSVSPDVIIQVLLREYLVETNRQRLLAYRRFRELRGDYWTLEHLEQQRWEYLYEQVPLHADASVVALRQDWSREDVWYHFSNCGACFHC